MTKNYEEDINGITLIALVITIIVSYDKIKKCCNIKSFRPLGNELIMA